MKLQIEIEIPDWYKKEVLKALAARCFSVPKNFEDEVVRLVVIYDADTYFASQNKDEAIVNFDMLFEIEMDKNGIIDILLSRGLVSRPPAWSSLSPCRKNILKDNS